MSVRKSVLSLGGLGFLAILSACGSAPNFSELQPIISVSCALASCHGSSKQGMMSLAASDAYCSLVGEAAGATYRDTAKAQFPRRVTPGSRDQSFVYKKLTLTSAESGDTKPLGDVMPQNQPFTDHEYIDRFGRWIDGGAKNVNGEPAPAGCP